MKIRFVNDWDYSRGRNLTYFSLTFKKYAGTYIHIGFVFEFIVLGIGIEVTK